MKRKSLFNAGVAGLVFAALTLVSCSSPQVTTDDLFGDGTGKSKREVQEWCEDLGIPMINDAMEFAKNRLNDESLTRSEGYEQAKVLVGKMSLAEVIAPAEVRNSYRTLESEFKRIQAYYDDGEGSYHFDGDTIADPSQKVIDFCEANGG